MKIYLLALTVLLFGCGKKSATDTDNTSQATYQAVCQVTDMQGNPVVCIDYPQDTAGQNTTCVTTEKNNFSAEGGSGAVYVALGAGASTSCAMTFPGKTYGISCGVAGQQVVRYYSSQFTQQEVQADCTARGGNLFPNEG